MAEESLETNLSTVRGSFAIPGRVEIEDGRADILNVGLDNKLFLLLSKI